MSPTFFFYLRPAADKITLAKDGPLDTWVLELLLSLMLDYLPAVAVAVATAWAAVVRGRSSKVSQTLIWVTTTRYKNEGRVKSKPSPQEDLEETRVFLYQALFFLAAQVACQTLPWPFARVLVETGRYAATMLIYIVVQILNLFQ